MFNLFKWKGGKPDLGAEGCRKQPSACNTKPPPGDAHTHDSDVTDKTQRKDVVNLLIPEINYSQKTGVGALLDLMAGKRRRNRKSRAESCRVSAKETQNTLQRSASNLETKSFAKDEADAEREAEADFVKALVLQKYAPKANPESKQHVSLVYVSSENDASDAEKRHAEALLRQIAKSIDCDIDGLDVRNKEMGNADTKPADDNEHYYEMIEDKTAKDVEESTKIEEESIVRIDDDNRSSAESLAFKRKSNLKLPKADVEGYSDDDRSDCGKKKVTFQKHVIFDDGEEQTDQEGDSSFESLTDEEEEYLEDSIPDNDELLGGYVVSRNETDNKTVINVNQTEENTNEPIKIRIECDLQRISSDNSDSGFLEIGDKSSDVKAETSESDVSDDDQSGDERRDDDEKAVIGQNRLQLVTEERCTDAERAREALALYRKEIEEKDREIDGLRCDLAAAYKEAELVKQRSSSLEEELVAARNSSADLAGQFHTRNDENIRQLRAQYEDVCARCAELESRVHALECECERLERERALCEQRANEALSSSEAECGRWRAAAAAARGAAAARAERILADCEWKMRELEKRARGAENENKTLKTTVDQLKSAPPTPAQVAELQQLRGVVSEQQRSVQSLTLQLQKVETREEALKLEVHRLKELLDKESRIGKEKEERYLQSIERTQHEHVKAMDALRSQLTASAATARAAVERAHGERTRNAIAQLRADAERDARNAERKLREVTNRLENLKEELETKEIQYKNDVAAAHSKADWDILQLRHLLDKADITYANNMDATNEKFEKEKERLIEEWSEKLRLVEEKANEAVAEAKEELEKTRFKLTAEKNEQINRLRENHRMEMDKQWDRFMTDKESCLERMKAECRQEGEEERVKREKELLDEIADLKKHLHSKSTEFDTVVSKAAACARTLAVADEELKEALAREKELRERRSEDAGKIRQLEKATRDQIDHLTRKCACLRKLFDDMRTRLSDRERVANTELRAKDKELHQLRAEVARLTKILIQQTAPTLETRTCADGCETKIKQTEVDTNRRSAKYKHKRTTLPDVTLHAAEENVRRRSNSVDLPAVQVPVRIMQLERKQNF